MHAGEKLEKPHVIVEALIIGKSKVVSNIPITCSYQIIRGLCFSDFQGRHEEIVLEHIRMYHSYVD